MKGEGKEMSGQDGGWEGRRLVRGKFCAPPLRVASVFPVLLMSNPCVTLHAEKSRTFAEGMAEMHADQLQVLDIAAAVGGMHLEYEHAQFCLEGLSMPVDLSVLLPYNCHARCCITSSPSFLDNLSISGHR